MSGGQEGADRIVEVLPGRDREEAIEKVAAALRNDPLRRHTRLTDEQLDLDSRVFAAQIVDALLGQPDPEGGDAHAPQSRSGLPEETDVARAGDAEDRVPGQPESHPPPRPSL